MPQLMRYDEDTELTLPDPIRSGNEKYRYNDTESGKDGRPVEFILSDKISE